MASWVLVDIKRNLNVLLSSFLEGVSKREKKAPPRLFCDICDCFDLHDTEDCPTQAQSPDSVPHTTYHGNPADERPYCDICEAFGHATESCNDDQTFQKLPVLFNSCILFLFPFLLLLYFSHSSPTTPPPDLSILYFYTIFMHITGRHCTVLHTFPQLFQLSCRLLVQIRCFSAISKYRKNGIRPLFLTCFSFKFVSNRKRK